MIESIIGYIIYFLVESLIFGVFALVISRKSKDEYDTLKAILVIVILLVLKSLLITPFINWADLRIANPEAVQILGTDKGSELMGFSLSSLVFNLIEGVIGYTLGKKILAKVNV